MKTIRLYLGFILCFLFANSFAQENEAHPLFQNQDPLQIKLSYSFSEIRKSRKEDKFFPVNLEYLSSAGSWESVPINIRARGNFRQDNCFFAPIKIKLKKKQVKGSILEGNKNLKLVIPCQNNRAGMDLIPKEFLCYKFYEELSPYAFHTRYVNASITDTGGKQQKVYELPGFLVEDDKSVAKRSGGKLVKELQINPYRLKDTVSVRLDFFQYMIANTDWSTYYQHNINMMQMSDRNYIPLSYDFDMSGLVDAPYAVVNEELPITTVRTRYYRGVCRGDEIFEYTRKYYLEKEQDIWAVFDEYSNLLNPREINSLKKYLTEFFQILKNDRRFKNEILANCR